MSLRIGDRGVAATVLSPSGIVQIDDRRLSARSAMEWIEAGEEVIVLRGDNQGLLVRAISDDFDVTALARFGEPVSASFGEAIHAAAVEPAERHHAWQAERRVYLRRSGLAIGAAFAVAMLWFCWADIVEGLGPRWAWIAASAVLMLGALAGRKLLTGVEQLLCSVEQSLHRLSVPTTCLVLIGFVAGFAWGLARHGIAGAILAGLAATILMGLPLPAAALLISGGVDSGEGGGIESASGE